MYRIFVYGTLKSGYANHSKLDNQKFLGCVTTAPKYKLINLYSYPGLILGEPGLSVKGELWQVDFNTLISLDILEGTPYLYKRDFIDIPGYENVQAYFFNTQLIVSNQQYYDEWPFIKCENHD